MLKLKIRSLSFFDRRSLRRNELKRRGWISLESENILELDMDTSVCAMSLGDMAKAAEAGVVAAVVVPSAIVVSTERVSSLLVRS